MKMKKTLLSLLFACFAFSSLAGAANEPKETDVIARIGDRKITLSVFEKVLKSYPDYIQKTMVEKPQTQAKLLNRFIQNMVISEAARKEGFDKEPDIRDHLEFIANDYISVEYVKRKATASFEITDKDIEHYYAAYKDKFKAPEAVRARHILVKIDKAATEDERKKLREKAEGILRKVKAGEDFSKIATELSDDPGSKANGGALGFLSRGRMVKPFEDVAFSLAPGEISGIVETDFGYHIIKVEERKASGWQTLDTVKEEIRKKLSEDFLLAKVKEVVEKMMKDAGAEVYPERLFRQEKPK